MIDALIIGAGPAGLSAAIASARQGLSVRVVDEFYRPGGRLLGQLHEEPDGVWWNGLAEAARLDQEAKELGVQMCCGVSVYDIARCEDRWRISTTEGEWEAPLLLIATGASETAVPVPGWTLPGVMSIGAAQVMTNVQRVRVGKKGVVIGVNILSVAIARELQLAGVHVEQMILPPQSAVSRNAAHPHEIMRSLLRVAHLAPSPLIRWGSKLMGSAWMQRLAVSLYPAQGVPMWDIPIHLRTAALEIARRHARSWQRAIPFCRFRLHRGRVKPAGGAGRDCRVPVRLHPGIGRARSVAQRMHAIAFARTVRRRQYYRNRERQSRHEPGNRRRPGDGESGRAARRRFFAHPGAPPCQPCAQKRHDPVPPGYCGWTRAGRENGRCVGWAVRVLASCLGAETKRAAHSLTVADGSALFCCSLCCSRR